MACISSRWARLLLMMHALLGAVLLGAGLNLASGADAPAAGKQTAPPAAKTPAAASDEPDPAPPEPPEPARPRAAEPASPPAAGGSGLTAAQQDLIALCQAALARQQAGQLPEAIAMFEKALGRARESLGKDHLDVGMVLGRLGMAHYEAKQYEQSAARFREALAILRLHLPREDLNVTLVVNELARALDEAGHHDEAAKRNEENLKVREASLGRKNPATLLSVHNLGMNYVKLHRWAEAIPLLERWLEESEPARLAKNPTLPITLEYLGDSHQAVGHHDKAEKYYNQVLAIVEAQPKKDFSHEVLILEKLVQLTSLQGPAGFDKAQKYGQRCVKTAQEHLGPEHLETAKALGVVGAAYYRMGEYAEAAPLARQYVGIARKIDRNDSFLTARFVARLVHMDLQIGEVAEAEELGISVLEQVETQLGSRSSYADLDSAISVFASLARRGGEAKRFAARMKQFLGTVEARAGKDDPALALALWMSAEACYQMAAAGPAEQYALRALAIQRKRLPADDLALAETLQTLGRVADVLSKYGEAEAYYLECLQIRRKKLGEQHVSVAACLSELGHAYIRMQRYPEAEASLRQARAIAEKAGPEGLGCATEATLQLGRLYDEWGSKPEVETLLKQGVAATRQLGGELNPSYAWALTYLAQFYFNAGRLSEAETTFQQALDVYRRVNGKEVPDPPVPLSGLGATLLAEGKYEEAERTLRQSLQASDWHGETSDRDRSIVSGNLARACLKRGLWEEAIAEFTAARQADRRWLSHVLPALSPAEQLDYLSRVEKSWLFASLAMVLPYADKPAAAAATAEWILNGKAVGAECLAEQMRLARQSSNPDVQEAVRELRALREQMASEVLRPQGASRAERVAEQSALYKKERDLLRKLGLQTMGGSRGGAEVKLADVRKALRGGSVLIEIVRVPLYAARAGDKAPVPAYYAAWIIPPAGAAEVQMVNLGDAATIDAAVARSRLAVVSYPQAIPLLGMQKAAQEADRAGRLLADLVYQPLREAIGDASTLLISPDGGLWLFPWEALPTGKGRFLVEEKQIVYVVTGRAILDDAPPKPGAGAVLFADPDYDALPTGFKSDRLGDWDSFLRQLLGRNPDAGLLAGARFRRLPVEGAVIDSLTSSLGDYVHAAPTIYQGKEASENAFKALHGPRVLMLATHGFFLRDQLFDNLPLTAQGRRASTAMTRDRLFGPHREEIPFVPEPLLRCGLALAGANEYYKARDANDGIVTGLEILGTDLRGTELVVLDACETGVGAVRDGEGTAGLHQAFQLAGARVVVASLWRIPAVPSNRLLEAFFANIARGQGTASSLRDAELKMIDQLRKTTGAAHPALWAAFTITGDCRETAGSRQPSPATASGVATKVAGDPVSKSPRAPAPKTAGETNPQPPADPYTTANRLLAHRDFGKAIAAYSEAIRLNPKYTLAYYGRGLAYAAQARYGEAIADYSQTLRLDPQFGLAYHQRGEAYVQANQVDAALADFNAWIQVAPKSPAAYVTRGVFFVVTGHLDKALADCSSALECDPKHKPAYRLRATIHETQKEFQKALVDNAELVRLDPAKAEGYLGQAFDHLKLKDNAKAVEDCDRAAQVAPQDALVFFTRATAYRALGEKDKADADMKRSAELARKRKQ